MRATIDSTGRLTVVPESEIEAYALRCYAEKFNSDTPPEICFQWEEIYTPGNVKASKRSKKRPRYFPITAEKVKEFVHVRQEAEAAPAPAGEVAELVAALRNRLYREDALRAADLLEQRQAAPVPVAVVNRLPGSEDCDTQGRCWMGYEDVHVNGLNQSCETWFWTLEHFSMLDEYSHWLPYSSISLPTSELG